MTSLPYGLWAVVLIASILVPAIPPGSPDGVLFGESFTLSAQETFSGNLIALGSVVTLERDSTFEGNIVLVGGSLESAGKVVGDIACVSAAVHLAATSSVDGSVDCIGTAPGVDPGARIAGSIQTAGEFPLSFSLPAGQAAPDSDDSGVNIGYEITVFLFRMFLLSAVAILIVLLLPAPAQRVSRTIVEKPAVSFLIGVLTMMGAIALFLLLALTVCLSPISLLGSAVLLVAILLGWTALGWEIGRQLFGIFRVQVHPAVMAGIGTALLTMVASGVGYVPFAGSVFILLVMSFGLGAVVLTRFGGPDYRILPKSTDPDFTPAQ